MCIVRILSIDRQFINEIPVRSVLDGIQYADQLATENPHRIYDVLDDKQNKAYSR